MSDVIYRSRKLLKIIMLKARERTPRDKPERKGGQAWEKIKAMFPYTGTYKNIISGETGHLQKGKRGLI